MVNVRPQHEVRFNVLLTEDREHAIEHWTQQLPRLLQPQGVRAYVVRTGREALDLAGQLEIHAAVIDLRTPAHRPEGPGGGGPASQDYPGGLQLLDLFRRLPRRPPIVLVNTGPYSQRQAERLLNEALRLGAFSVINRPVELEGLLAVIRRLVDRRYAGAWPTPAPAPGRSPGNAPAPAPGASAPGAPSSTFHSPSSPTNPELNVSAEQEKRS